MATYIIEDGIRFFSYKSTTHKCCVLPVILRDQSPEINYAASTSCLKNCNIEDDMKEQFSVFFVRIYLRYSHWAPYAKAHFQLYFHSY